MSDAEKIARLSGLDGITHINIYSKADTVLGRWLSHFAVQPIDLDKHGYFESNEGYWYWLKFRDDKLRYLHGAEAKKHGQKLEKTEHIVLQSNDLKFRLYVMIANFEKLKANPEMAVKFKASELTFKHYYSYGGNDGSERRLTLLPQHAWITDFWTNLRDEFASKQNIYYVDIQSVTKKTFEQIKALKQAEKIEKENDYGQSSLF